ncbi:MAG: amino acid adenylation domain-containing protein [Bacteroidales bacterium]|nr:amino acid adenylation domain-containing protein [Bacteroidales bacterium]
MKQNSSNFQTIVEANQSVKEKKYWMSKYSGEFEKSIFPYDSYQKSDDSKEEYLFNLPTKIASELLRISANSDSKLYIIITAGLAALVNKYTENEDITLGSTIENQKSEAEFINTILPLRVNITKEMSFKDLILNTRKTIVEAIENQNYPMEVLVNDLYSADQTNDFPLFDIAVTLDEFHNIEYLNSANPSILFNFKKGENEISCSLKYKRSRYTLNTITKLKDHFIYFLEKLIENIDEKISNIQLISQEEYNDLIVSYNATTIDNETQTTLHELFEEQVNKVPENIAVIDNNKEFSYREINQKSEKLAELLIKKGVKSDTIVGIMISRSVEMVIGILGILKAGGAYLPIDVSSPENRIKFMLQDSRVKLLLTSSKDKNDEFEIENILLDEDKIYEGEVHKTDINYSPSNLAYVIYTSGTTGKPKGVLIEHKSIVNYTRFAIKNYVKGDKSAFPLFTSISFDLTVTSVFTPLLTGNTLIIFNSEENEVLIDQVIEDNRINIIKLTPSHLKLIRDQISKNTSIKRIIVGGEQLDVSLANEIYNNTEGRVEIFNEYGPTEATVGCMIHKFDSEKDIHTAVSIGKPIDNMEIYILNKELKPLPLGVEGDLYIGGIGLAREYLFRPELNSEKFIDSPFKKGEKIYKSGDRAIFISKNNIEFRGRNDQQIKIRGYRIELGDIESKMLSYLKDKRNSETDSNKELVSLDLEEIKFCNKCVIPHNFDGITIDEEGVCSYCREYEGYKEHVDNYFKSKDDLLKIIEEARKNKKSDYDCLLLYSGGKDSSYVLDQLVKMNLKVLAFTYDNGHVSQRAFDNIKKNTAKLGVDSIIVDSQNINKVLVESLKTEHNVCNGCFKGVNTIGTKVAHDHGINMVFSGLSRGQIFEIKLHGLFKLGIFDEKSIDEKLKIFRKQYHSMDNKTSRLLNVPIPDEAVNNIDFIDYFRYDEITVKDILNYLIEIDKNWIRPADTGSSSSNCLINDVGIYVHIKDKGYHFYSAQLGWDCRLGVISREEGIEEITDFEIDINKFNRVLNEIGYFKDNIDVVVVEKYDKTGDNYLCAYIVSEEGLDVADIKQYMSRDLPDYMIPSYFVKIDIIPLSPSGKVNVNALPEPKSTIENIYVAPQSDSERKLVEIWAELLNEEKEKISINSNFFEMGGHSLKATMLVTKMQVEFNVKIPLSEMFKYPTIRELAQLIKAVSIPDQSQELLIDEADKIEI